ncbi:VQ motif-containing protein 8, chloroplastic-like [Cannabis sativa]|uniref:VQ motif-containing protein 8, chloroplastic-like n=1 Tax=Cannabis sativa TaxID=3483 RepID=UPI0029C9DFBA|nr:VQ motif-containing protein 8, chloroplastic-like [Cannabis sativa]
MMNGPRPSRLTIINENSTKRSRAPRPPPPVVVYLNSPKIIHVRPEEFMGLVQQLTGKQSASSATAVSSSSASSSSSSTSNTFEVAASSRSSIISSSCNLDGY